MLMPTMRNILLCSSDPLLVKNLSNVLRNEGFAVVTVEHPAFAVKKVLQSSFDVVVVDSEPFGMSAEEATLAIKAVSPQMPVLMIGNGGDGFPAGFIWKPVDLEAFRRAVQHAVA